MRNPVSVNMKVPLTNIDLEFKKVTCNEGVSLHYILPRSLTEQ